MVNINFIGRLGADCEVKTSNNGRQFVTFRVATDEFIKGEKSTAWLNVTYIGDRAVKMSEYLKKGHAVSVIGSETIRTYQNNNGETAFSRDVLADRVDFVNLGQSKDGQSNDGAVTDKAPQTKAKDNDIAVAAAATTSNDDDLPF